MNTKQISYEGDVFKFLKISVGLIFLVKSRCNKKITENNWMIGKIINVNSTWIDAKVAKVYED